MADLAALYGGLARPWEVGLRPVNRSDHGRWLCSICRQFRPLPVAPPRRREVIVCAACGCGQDMHSRWRGPFDTGCSMAWADVQVWPDGGEQLAMRHCPCDGYQVADTPAQAWPSAHPRVHRDGSRCIYRLPDERARSRHVVHGAVSG